MKMSGWSPSPEDPAGGTEAGPPGDTAPGYGYAQPGAYEPPRPYETPGPYGPPDSYGTYPPPRRRPARIWFAIIAGIVVVAAVIAGVSAYLLHTSRKWVLTAPSAAAGMSRDTSSIDELSFGSAVARFKSDVTSLPHYGHLRSTVSGIYTLGSSQAVGFVGFNGTFNVQVVLKSAGGLKVSSVNPGPHGGVAECGTSSSYTICQWSTPTTVGIVVILPTSGTGPAESVSAAGNLMVRLRDSVEHPAR